MRNFNAGFIVANLVLLTVPVAFAQTAPTVPPVAAAVPEEAPRPLNPADMPPNPPKVTCKGDLLTISAENSTLESILAAVRGCSGAKIEVPAGAARTRTFEELGPGPVRQVLDSLLSGSEFDYVIESSATNPHQVSTVLLTSRKKNDSTGTPAADLALTPARRAWLQSRQNGRGEPPADADSNAETEAPAAENKPPSSPSTDADNSSPANIEPPAAEVAAAARTNAPAGEQPKSTEDRITSMQQLFDQRRQMIQKQNTGQGSTPN